MVNQKETAVNFSFSSIIKQIYVTNKDSDLKLLNNVIRNKKIQISAKSISTLIL